MVKIRIDEEVTMRSNVRPLCIHVPPMAGAVAIVF